MEDQSFLFNSWEYNYQKHTGILFFLIHWLYPTSLLVNARYTENKCIPNSFWDQRDLGSWKGNSFFLSSCPWIEEGPQAERRWAILGSKVLQKVEREREQGGRATFVCFLFLLLVTSLKLGSAVAVVEASAPSFPRRLGFPEYPVLSRPHQPRHSSPTPPLVFHAGTS